MRETTQASKRRKLAPMTEQRAYRLRRGIVLAAAAVYAGIPPTRASIIERDPSQATGDELERLRCGVDRAAEESKERPAS